MPANAYPHLVFATDATTLPRTDLESIVTQVFGDREPAPSVEQGPLQAIVHLGDYDFTLWYDDDSEGLPGRYADFAPTLKRRRISRCTTMIDLSGDADPDGMHAEDARVLTTALAEREGVYVFSEESKSFVGIDEADPFADTLEPTVGRPEDRVAQDAPAQAPAPAASEPAASEPTAGPVEPVEEPVGPSVAAPEVEVAPEPVDIDVEPETQLAMQEAPAPDATQLGADEPVVAQSVEMPPDAPVDGTPVEAAQDEAAQVEVAPVEAAPVEGEPAEGAQVDDAQGEAAQGEAAVGEAPAAPEAAPTPEVEPTPEPQAAPTAPQAPKTEEEKEGGFFKRLFGRRR